MKKKLSYKVVAHIPTEYGDFKTIAYAESPDAYTPQLAMLSESFDPKGTVLLRLHSECVTGDIFHSKRCDCGQQLDSSLRKIAQSNGLLLYLRQEGRGIGILSKLKAYNLQDEGADTQKANEILGFKADARDYSDAIAILKDLGVTKVRLITNNPSKLEAIEEAGIEIVERVPLIIEPNEVNEFYLNTKRDKMGHLL